MKDKDSDKFIIIRCVHCESSIGVGFHGNYGRWDGIILSCISCHINEMQGEIKDET